MTWSAAGRAPICRLYSNVTEGPSPVTLRGAFHGRDQGRHRSGDHQQRGGGDRGGRASVHRDERRRQPHHPVGRRLRSRRCGRGGQREGSPEHRMRRHRGVLQAPYGRSELQGRARRDDLRCRRAVGPAAAPAGERRRGAPGQAHRQRGGDGAGVLPFHRARGGAASGAARRASRCRGSSPSPRRRRTRTACPRRRRARPCSCTISAAARST